LLYDKGKDVKRGIEMYQIKPIAHVRNDRREVVDDNWGDVVSEIELVDDFSEESIQGLEDFSHVEVIFYMDQVEDEKIETKARHPRNNPNHPLVGIFAQRGKNRPNKLGLTTVEIMNREDRTLIVKGLDAVNGTPIIDLKPVMNEFLPRNQVVQPEWTHDVMKEYWRQKVKLVGEKVIIREIEEADLYPLWQLIYGEEAPEWKKWDAPYFPLHHEDFDTFSKQKRENMFVIEVKEEIIGIVSYYWEHEPSKWLEVGIGIYKPMNWNGGYGTEALRLWIDHVMNTKDIPRIGLTTWSGNERMVAVAERLGMKVEGRMRNCREYEGKRYDSIRMGMLREEWEAMKKLQTVR
jgi:tRNA-Thr(GGU) m(6)t(6)A37 methyltransferase TsaA